MDDNAVRNLMYSINLIATNLNTRPDSWREQLQAVRYTTSSHEFTDTVPSESRKRWQVPMVDVFQRVAFADADNGAVQDVADWCLRQLLTLYRLYPQDVTILRLIGRNWLLRAQRSLANIHRAERASSSSSGASASAPQPEGQEEQDNRTRTLTDVEDRTQGADYVEARGILVPATEYFQRAVTATYASGNVEGVVLADAAEAQMSLGNVTSTRSNDSHFRQAIYYLRAAAAVPGYSLPAHLQQYLAEHGSLYT